jgi:hypothetical protein
MDGRSWRLVPLADVPAEKGLPPPDDGVSEDDRETVRTELRDDAGAILGNCPAPHLGWDEQQLSGPDLHLVAVQEEAGATLDHQIELLVAVLGLRVRDDHGLTCDGLVRRRAERSDPEEWPDRVPVRREPRVARAGLGA